jgi:hypothetical protein
VVTRPEPTIYGNCDSWSFIVGKKPGAYREPPGREGSLQGCNSIFIHRLSTKRGGIHLDKLWAICGRPVEQLVSSRMVVWQSFDMPLISARRTPFYLKTLKAQFNVSKRTLFLVQNCTTNISAAVEKKPQTRLRAGAFASLTPD